MKTLVILACAFALAATGSATIDYRPEPQKWELTAKDGSTITMLFSAAAPMFRLTAQYRGIKFEVPESAVGILRGRQGLLSAQIQVLPYEAKDRAPDELAIVFDTFTEEGKRQLVFFAFQGDGKFLRASVVNVVPADGTERR